MNERSVFQEEVTHEGYGLVVDSLPNLFIHSRKAFKNCLVLWTLSVLSATEEAVEMALVREEKVFSVIK